MRNIKTMKVGELKVGDRFAHAGILRDRSGLYTVVDMGEAAKCIRGVHGTSGQLINVKICYVPFDKNIVRYWESGESDPKAQLEIYNKKVN